MKRLFRFPFRSRDEVRHDVEDESVVMLMAVALVAGYLPARRASRIEPMRALRWE